MSESHLPTYPLTHLPTYFSNVSPYRVKDLRPRVLAESEARRVTRGNLTLVDKNARWRQDPATDKQLAILANHGVYRPELTKGAASDLLAQIFARDDT